MRPLTIGATVRGGIIVLIGVIGPHYQGELVIAPKRKQEGLCLRPQYVLRYLLEFSCLILLNNTKLQQPSKDKVTKDLDLWK